MKKTILLNLVALILLSSLQAQPLTATIHHESQEKIVQGTSPSEIVLQGTQAPQYKKSLKILSWNVYMLPYFIFKKSKKVQRARAIAEELNKSDYDIIMLQEAFKHRPRRILKKKLKEKHPYVYGPVNHKALSLRTNSGLIVLSNRPLIEKGTVEYDACASWDCMSRKGAILLEGEHHGHQFQVVVTHANTGPFIIKQHQYHMIYDGLLQPFYEKGIPQIIAGDMNCSSTDKNNYEAMLRILDAEDTPLTGERRYSNREHSSIIDYIFLRRNESTIKQIQKNITLIGPDWDPSKEKTQKQGGLGLSDHFPVEIEVIFP